MVTADDLERLLAEQPGMSARQLAAALDGASKKDVNKALYRGERAGRFHRSKDARPLWSLDRPSTSTDPLPYPAVPRSADTDLGARLEPYIGATAAELNATYDLEVSLASKQQVREVAERLSELAGSPLSAQHGTTRVIRIHRHRKAPAEDVQLGIVPFDELATTPFHRSRLLHQVSSVDFLLFSREAELSASRFLGVHRWMPDEAEIALVGADYEAARSAVRRSDLSAVPKATAVNVVRYGTKGRVGADTMLLPDGTPATKRAFYIVKRHLRSVLANGRSDGERTRTDGDGTAPQPSENAGLLLDLLRSKLD